MASRQSPIVGEPSRTAMMAVTVGRDVSRRHLPPAIQPAVRRSPALLRSSFAARGTRDRATADPPQRYPVDQPEQTPPGPGPGCCHPYAGARPAHPVEQRGLPRAAEGPDYGCREPVSQLDRSAHQCRDHQRRRKLVFAGKQPGRDPGCRGQYNQRGGAADQHDGYGFAANQLPALLRSRRRAQPREQRVPGSHLEHAEWGSSEGRDHRESGQIFECEKPRSQQAFKLHEDQSGGSNSEQAQALQERVRFIRPWRFLARQYSPTHAS